MFKGEDRMMFIGIFNIYINLLTKRTINILNTLLHITWQRKLVMSNGKENLTGRIFGHLEFIQDPH